MIVPLTYFKVSLLQVPYQIKKVKTNTQALLQYNWFGSVVWDKAELTGESCPRCWNANGSGITRDTLLLSSENTEQMKAHFPPSAFVLTKDIVVPLFHYYLIVTIYLGWEEHAIAMDINETKYHAISLIH